MVDVQFQVAEMPMMTATPSLDDDCQLFAERTARIDPAKPGLNNLWLRRRAEYTALNRSGCAAVHDVDVEYVAQ